MMLRVETKLNLRNSNIRAAVVESLRYEFGPGSYVESLPSSRSVLFGVTGESGEVVVRREYIKVPDTWSLDSIARVRTVVASLVTEGGAA